ncbi:MAG TPA: type II secretion system protein [Candidatus Paceibacterota bacterium]|jgi:prepilin-type N-terminal cleavage/methylation domain
MKKSQGFTAVELIISLVVIGLLAAVSAVPFANIARRNALDATATAIATALRQARAQTLASVGSDQYGVKIDGDRYTLFKGAVFSSSTPSNSTFMFSSYVSASSTQNVFVFKKVTGNAVTSGMIEAYLRGSPSTKKVIMVESTGLANIK